MPLFKDTILIKGPDDPYYFGLTVSETTTADFGVNCDMPGLHFDDTCVTDDDCSEFPNTGMEINEDNEHHNDDE